MDAKTKSVCKKAPTKTARKNSSSSSKRPLTPPRSFRLASSISIGAAANKLAEAGMLCNDILPCVPAVDNGFDTLACVYGTVFNRVQVRGQRTCANGGNRFCFSLLRRKERVRRGKKRSTIRRKRFTVDDIDVFVFVHIRYLRFFIVPASAIDLTKNSITFHPGCEWENAWHYLKTGAAYDAA